MAREDQSRRLTYSSSGKLLAQDRGHLSLPTPHLRRRASLQERKGARRALGVGLAQESQPREKLRRHLSHRLFSHHNSQQRERMQELLQLICACVLSSTFAAASPLPVVRAAELVKRQATETTAPTSTAGSSTTSSASSPGNTDRTSWRGSFSNQTGEPSPMLSIVTIALVVAMILILLLAR